MNIKCKICGRECDGFFRSYCSFECLNDAMNRMSPNNSLVN